MVNIRPKVGLVPTTLDKILEILGWGFILAIWFLVIASYANLPDTIPIHYNGSGQVDGFGNKNNILELPIMATIMFIGLTILNKFPHIFNYPTVITENNAVKQYTSATRLIRYLKCIIVLIFGLIAYFTIRSASDHPSGLGVWFLPVILGLIFIPLTFYLIKSLKK